MDKQGHYRLVKISGTIKFDEGRGASELVRKAIDINLSRLERPKTGKHT